MTVDYRGFNSCSFHPVGGVSDTGAHRGRQTKNPGFSFIHHVPHAAGYTQRRGTQQFIWIYVLISQA